MNITKHAKQRMDQRNISVGDVKLAIALGNKLVNRTDSNKWTFAYDAGRLLVVTNKACDTVITAFKMNG
jgi:hypothetical protein